jgi:hypothetical protein
MATPMPLHRACANSMYTDKIMLVRTSSRYNNRGTSQLRTILADDVFFFFLYNFYSRAGIKTTVFLTNFKFREKIFFRKFGMG